MSQSSSTFGAMLTAQSEISSSQPSGMSVRKNLEGVETPSAMPIVMAAASMTRRVGASAPARSASALYVRGRRWQSSLGPDSASDETTRQTLTAVQAHGLACIFADGHRSCLQHEGTQAYGHQDVVTNDPTIAIT